MSDIHPIDEATQIVFEHCHGDHTHECAWHSVMAVAENWATSQVEDPTAVWCQGDPTTAVLVEAARDLISGYCNC